MPPSKFKQLVGQYLNLLKGIAGNGLPDTKGNLYATFDRIHDTFLEKLYLFQKSHTPTVGISRKQYLEVCMRTPFAHLGCWYDFIVHKNMKVYDHGGDKRGLASAETLVTSPIIRLPRLFSSVGFPILQWDAAFDYTNKVGGGGYIIRNPGGGLLYHRFFDIKTIKMGVNGAKFAECYALKEGLDHCHNLRYKNIKMIGDADDIIKIVKGIWEIPEVMYDDYCQLFLLLRNFEDFDIQHIFRENNVAADFLSKIGLDVARGRQPPPLVNIVNDLKKIVDKDNGAYSIFRVREEEVNQSLSQALSCDLLKRGLPLECSLSENHLRNVPSDSKGVSLCNLTTANTILLVGLVNSGKTVIFHKLQGGSSHRVTLTSKEPNEGSFLLHSGPTKKGKVKPVRIVDIPGHFTLRLKFDEFLPNVAGIVFVVDASEFKLNCPAASEYLYDILVKLCVVKKEIPILILCNKVDKVNARTNAFIRGQLEKEIEKLRASRTAGSSANIANGFMLGVPGEAFAFSKCRNKVTVAEGSGLTGKVFQLEEFIREHVKPV